MKKIMVSGLLLSFLIITPNVAIASGPFENYLDCAGVCIDKYDKWTIRRSACAADCYVALVASPIKAVVEML